MGLLSSSITVRSNGMLAERNDRHGASHHVQQERSEITDERHDDDTLRNACGKIV
jgi:hypothetical protein